MANKNIQLKNQAGDLLFPKTKASIVFNNNNEALGGVEAGAQVNKIETVKVNGTALSIADKAVDITIASQSEYTIAKAETAETGFLATYNLTKDGTAVGASINIPKDFLVKSGSVKTCEEADKPVQGYKVGDKYIDFVINSKEGSATDEHMYILVSDLVDEYTVADTSSVDMTLTGREISAEVKLSAVANNGLSVKEDGLYIDISGKADKATTLAGYGIGDAYTKEEVNTELGKKQDNLSTAQLAAANSGVTADKVSAYDTHVANADIHVTSAQKTEWSGKQDALSEAQLSAVNSGITATKVGTYDGYATTIAGKADKATSLSGYGITDAYTKTEIDNMALITYEELA